jgi:uncharacterized protein with von Willebrand factor type A (vWA) domain
MSRGFRYARWDGTQEPIGEDVTVEKIVEELSEDILEGLDPATALNRLMRRGVPGQFGGLQSLLDRVRKARAAERQRGRLDGFLESLREQLDDILETERLELSARDDAEARMAESWLDSLPESVAGRMSELKNYDFTSAEARASFQQLLDKVRQQMLDAYVRGMTQGMRDMSPEQRAAMKDMLSDLNALLEQRRAGTGPSQEQFDEFMRRHGSFFPENPRTLDELLEQLARRSAALSRLMASLSPEQRAELEALAREMLEDMDLAFEVDRLWDSLRDLAPGMPWDDPAPIDGDAPMGLTESLDAIERLADYEQLERALKAEHPGAALEDIDIDRLRRTLGDDAVRDVERLRRVERALEEAGIMTRRSGEMELTPRGIRKLGERALARVFERLTLDRPGPHDVHRLGGNGEPTGSTRQWRWGDDYRIDVQRTVSNAVLRGGPSSSGVRLRADDFEIVEAEHRTTAATVLLLDMSFSMPMRGNWVPAKRMALALHSLIASKYPEDHLSIVGFSDVAREIKPDDLVQAGWEHVYGTNMQHAFHLAGRLLAKHRGATKQVLLVTDGEPTAHLTDDGHVFFQWPPVRETLEKTYKEAMRLAPTAIWRSSPQVTRRCVQFMRSAPGRAVTFPYAPGNRAAMPSRGATIATAHTFHRRSCTASSSTP